MKKVLVDNKAVPQGDTVVKFGFGQISKTTPAVATWIFRAILYASFIVNGALQIFHGIPEDLKGQIAIYSIEIVTFVHMLTKLFGLDVKGPNE